MGSPSYVRSVFDRNVVMRHITILQLTAVTKNQVFATLYISDTGDNKTRDPTPGMDLIPFYSPKRREESGLIIQHREKQSKNSV